jgi:class 3 adenylate cyclase/tetratricopeptide (TPR) repeat protein
MGPDRRAVTVMFCDLVGSTAMSEVLDPEELLEVISAYQSVCRQIVEEHGGHVAVFLGDGVLALFGYPVAHDDDVQRSVRTGLEVIQATQKINTELDLRSVLVQTRIGIHTGTVVAGMLQPGSDGLTVVGSTPNIAARLQEIAEPDSVAVSADSQRLAEGYFQWRDLGDFTLKGISEPVHVYRALEPSNIRTPFELALQKGLRRLVGRESELDTLRGLYRTAGDGAGQIVCLRGDGGIGKSRLLHAIREDEGSAEGVWLIGRCMAESSNTAFFPILEVVRSLIGVDPADSHADQRRKLEYALVNFEEPEADRLLSALLSLEPEDDAEPLMLSPELQRRRTMETLSALLVHRSRADQLAIVIEDLHWVDPSTLEFLEMFGVAIQNERVLLLLSYRPSFNNTFSSAASLKELPLAPLDPAEVRDLITEVSGGVTLPPGVIDQIVVQADGVPLFVEELTRMVLESGQLGPDGWSEPEGGIATLSIPSTLESSLRTRLDRLGDAKAVAQVAAVVGRDFDWMMLESFGMFDDANLERSLDALVAAELVGQTGSPPEAHYTFRHALIQDAAYQSLLKRTRREYHGRIAELAVLGQSGVLDEHPEFVARHFSEAGMPEQAVQYWLLAGQQASNRSANVEAIAHFDQGLVEVEALPDDRSRWRTELALVMGLGPALNAARGYGSAEAERAYTQALELCEKLGDAPELFWVLWGLGAYRQARAQHIEALEKGRQIQQLAESRPELQAEAHFGVGTSLFYLGNIVEGREELEEGSEFFLSHVGQKDVSPTGHHAGVMSLGYLAIALWHLGYVTQSVRRADQGIHLALEIGHPFVRFQSYHWAGIASFLAGDLERTRHCAEEESKISTEYGFPFGQLGSSMTLAWFDAHSGDQSAVDRLRFGVNAQRGVGARVGLTYFLAMLADACHRVGRIDDGLEAVAEGLTEVEETAERPWEPELYRIRGCLLAERDPAQAEESMRTALAVAGAQQARSVELRAALSLAELLDGSDRQPEVIALLADLDEQFTDGHNTTDHALAKRLIAG